MSYRDFRLPDVLERFQLVTREEPGIFAGRAPIAPSALLVEVLRVNVPLAFASGNEKGRSEFLIAPVLTELKRLIRPAIGLFSGVELSVDVEAGLTGTCDFLLSAGPELLFVKAPLIALVEAKNENMREGMGQCAAEMVAAQMFNQRAGAAVEAVYGAVTTGTSWIFMSLASATLSIDLHEYSIDQPERILGILASMLPA
jgi:hypothetical protein